jgi:hypothetical protein
MEPFAYVLMNAGPLAGESHSALPGAPVVAHTATTARVKRVRAGAAAALRRLAEVLAPEPSPVAARGAQ